MSRKIPVLMYHKIGHRPDGAVIKGHYVSCDLFHRQLRTLKTLGYRGITFRSLLEDGPTKGTAVLTFDDGYANFYENAVPEMELLGWHGTVFVVTATMGGVNTWDTNWGEAPEPIMSWDQARDCIKRGMEVGSHTINHPKLAELSDEEGKAELEGSLAALKENLGEAKYTFCYPFGSYRPETAVLVQKAGYLGATTVKKGSYIEGMDPFQIPRINVRSDTAPPVLAYKLFRALVLNR